MLYKVLNDDGTACNGGRGRWPLPQGDQPGEWLKVKGALTPCANGLHLVDGEGLLDWLGPAVWEAEHKGEAIQKDEHVLVVRKARLLRQVKEWNQRTARLFACDCAERALKHEQAAGREPDGRSWEAIEVARRFANGEATKGELETAWAAARAAAGAAAGAATWAAADSAWAAAGAAVWGAADSAWAAAGAAAGAAADSVGAAERKWQAEHLLKYLGGS